jgi:hypothetical protein
MCYLFEPKDADLAFFSVWELGAGVGETNKEACRYCTPLIGSVGDPEMPDRAGTG